MAKQKKDIERPTAKEYLQQMKDLQDKMFKLDLVVVTRLYTLCVSYPEAPIQVLLDDSTPQSGVIEIKAKSLIPENRGKSVINQLPYEERIRHIQAIEKWLADRHPHKQTKMF